MARPALPTGIHHVTGIAGDARANVDFYTDALGLGFLVRTVNFEDVLVPHLYYGDRDGSLGSILTFFSFGETDPGRVGPPQTAAVGLAVPESAFSFWIDRLEGREVAFEGPIERFDERLLRLSDPDGTPIELVAVPDDGSRPEAAATGGQRNEPSAHRSIPNSARVRRIHGVTLHSVNPYATAATLETFGLERVGGEGDRFRYRIGDGAGGDRGVVDLIEREEAFGREGPGTLHHLAFQVSDREALAEWHALFREREADVSRIKDRHFFHSLYVREPGGILFELATARPGLSIAASHDPRESIYLPARFEHQRDLVEAQHPAPGPSRGGAEP